MRPMTLTTESRVSDGAGSSVVVWRVDVRAPADRLAVATLVKFGRSEHAMSELRTIRVSKPVHFRNYGEGLVRDPSEGEASKTEITGQRIDDPQDLQELQAFHDEVGQCAEKVGESIRITVSGLKTTTERGRRILFGRNCWIYSTAIEPTTDEQWDCLSESLDPAYDHVEYIHRPSQFAWSLGLMVVEQLGPRGRDEISTDSHGDEFVETRTRGQLIVHGPVVYVADPFGVIDSAQTDVERVLLPVFVKHHRFAGQREYRFVIWAEAEPPECVVDLNVSSAMLGSLEKRPPEPAGLARAMHAADCNPAPAESPDVTEDRDQDVPSKEPLDSTSDWFWPGLLGSGDNPATPLSRTIDADEYAGNPPAATTAAALSALRSKVAEVQGERRSKVASSAWHAEPWISHLCRRFKDPIGGISITDDDILVVSLKLPRGVDGTAKMSFGPSGAYVHAVRGATEQLILHSPNPEATALPAVLGKKLSRLGLKPWPKGDGGANQDPAERTDQRTMGPPASGGRNPVG